MSREIQTAEARRALLAAERLLIVSHQNPDGDAIGSCLALAAGLESLGKHCDVVNIDGVPTNLAWLPLAERVQLSPDPGRAYDALVLLDCGSAERTGFGAGLLERAPLVVNIDHHPGNGNFGTVNLVDPGACATAELVHELLTVLPARVGYAAAVSIYTAVVTDTGSFRFSNTNARAFDLAASMVAKGVEPACVAQMVYDQQPANRLRLLSQVLETLDLSPRDKAACVVVTRAMLRDTHCGADDTEGFVNFPRSICGVEVGLLLREEQPDRFRVAFRSKGRVDVAQIARELGGGGHHNAAGATLDGSAQEIKRRIFERVEHALDEALFLHSRAS